MVKSLLITLPSFNNLDGGEVKIHSVYSLVYCIFTTTIREVGFKVSIVGIGVHINFYFCKTPIHSGCVSR